MTEHKKVMKFLKRFKKNWTNQEIPDFMINNNILIAEHKNFLYEIRILNEFVAVYQCFEDGTQEKICSSKVSRKYLDDLIFWLNKNA